MVSYRHELKYLCPETELLMAELRLRPLMSRDPHADGQGEYSIRSVYFDDYSRKCFYDSENGVEPREKFRIRIYNRSDSLILLEKKSKAGGVTGKQSCVMDRDTCEKMLRGEELREQMGLEPLLDEWIVQRNTRLLHPVLLGEYIRTPYVYPLGNVRVTFDRKIMASPDYTKLFSADALLVPVLPAAVNLMEVKYDRFLPDILAARLNGDHWQPGSFSKFYLGCLALEGRLKNDF